MATSAMTRAEFDARRRAQLARGDHPGRYTCPMCGHVETSANPISGGLTCKFCNAGPDRLTVAMTWAPEAPT